MLLPRSCVVLLCAAIALLGLCDLVAARSPHPPPVKRVHHSARSALRILPRGTAPGLSVRSRAAPAPASLRHDDTLLLTASLPSLFPYELSFLLHPSEHLFHPQAKVTYQDDLARTSRTEPLRAEDYRLYTGDVLRPSWTTRAWHEEMAGLGRNPNSVIGSARVMVHNVGDNDVEWEGVFTVDGVSYNVLTRQHYEVVKSDRDANVASLGNNMVVYSHDDEETPAPSDPYDMARRHLFGRNDMGGMTGDSNYIDSINSTKGCPTDSKLLYMGVAIDCNYVAKYVTEDAARLQVLNDWNSLGTLFRQTFNVNLGIIELIVKSGSCPSTSPADEPWNVNCSDSITLDDRLSMFSKWRGEKGEDDVGLWHLMSDCSTGTEVGVAWLGVLCKSDSTQNTEGQYTSGTGVSTAATNEWALIAHEIGHGFGAIHDCADDCVQPGSTTKTIPPSPCCPFTKSSCDAGSTYIMNPTTASTEKTFSGCTKGNVCTWLGANNPSCLENPGGKKTIGLKQCGNGIVEDGEECDPGAGAESNCCDPDTCKFRQGAVCEPANSKCCTDSCQIAKAGTVCRAAIDPTCDFEETCTGSDAACPEDKTAKDGTKCGNDLACASGHCTSLNQQCKSVSSGNLTQACGNRNERSCVVTCKDPDVANLCTILQTPLIDGSPCGYGGRCYNSTCKAGSWQDTLAGWYTQNLQIAIPVTIAAGLIVLAILWSVGRCICGCCGGRKNKSRKMPIAAATAISRPRAARQDTYTPLGTGQPGSDEELPMQQMYRDPYSHQGGQGGGAQGSNWVDPKDYNGPDYGNGGYGNNGAAPGGPDAHDAYGRQYR